jgi:hypothetical protein
VRAPIDVNRLWPSLRTAEEASRRGTELLHSLHRLLVRNNPSSKAWREERRKILDAIEAHLAATTDVGVGSDPENPPSNSYAEAADRPPSVDAA